MLLSCHPGQLWTSSGTAAPAPGLAQRQFPHCRDSGAQGHGQRPGEQHSCLQSCPAQMSLAPKALFLSRMRTCQALHCSDLNPPCPSQDSTRELQNCPVRGDAAPHPPWVTAGPVLTPHGAVLGCARPAGHSHPGSCPAVTCCCDGPVGIKHKHVSTELSPAWCPGWAAGAHLHRESTQWWEHYRSPNLVT